ncbi:MAG TPA: peptide deformylase [Casimicrobiaceae bacterium]
MRALYASAALAASAAHIPAPALLPCDRRYLGDRVLHAIAMAVDSRSQVDREIAPLVLGMRHLLTKLGGLGLAAPQVGSGFRVIVVSFERKVHALINPRITWRSDETRVETEGCLSIPGFWTPMRRHTEIEVEFRDLYFNEATTGRVTGLAAAVLQHEIDHLDGITIVDGLSRQQRRHAERIVGKARGAA